ncbi:amidohydrolase [Sphingobacterium tabacisoli]|uniref:Amidohydrolase n=1 Tax=Sphingobacterium tabacisoli TaxID=2044855 RepID=A0ABW5L1V7_9SPHI|nr:amidohydrolase [Sphingobacterium tabacisoli]
MKQFFTILLPCLVAMSSCKQAKQHADVIYYGGTILTMEDSLPSAQALAVENGRIIFVGSKEGVQDYIGKNTRKFDLKGHTLMPGFIDAHGHITSRAGMIQTVDLSPSPYGTVNSIPDLQKALKSYMADISKTESPIMGNGYDDAIMVEHRHPTRQELDEVSTTRPIIIIHASGHSSVANSAMLRLLNISEEIQDPIGGHYGRDSNHRLNGKLEENASFAALMKLPQLMPVSKNEKGVSQELSDFLKAQDEWLSYGQTTICDGRTMGVGVDLLQEVAERKLLKADIVYFPDFEANKKQWQTFVPDYMKYKNRLKFGGFKFSNDGSPQAKTAWLTIPYWIPPEGEDKTYKGFPIFTDEQLYEDLKTIFGEGITAQLHVNGDAAIDQALRVIGKLKEEGVYNDTLRATLIHVQNSRPDHIHKIVEVGLIPSYFSSHVYLWGDWHYNSVFGPQRAAFLSPARAAQDADLPFTIHHDAPVTPPDLMTGVFAAVNRTTRTGRLLGGDQRIVVLEALKAITIHAAYQYHEEDGKGSLKKGKLADLVILDQNPLTIDPSALRSIQVLETIKEGTTVYRK